MDYTYAPGVEREDEKTADEAAAEMHKLYSELIYKTTSKAVGSTAHMISTDIKHGKSSKFSKPLTTAGMYKHSGLNTHVERDRVYDGSKDWMDKIN